MSATAGGRRRPRLTWTVFGLALVGIVAMNLIVTWQWRSGLAHPYSYWLESTVGAISYGAVGAFIVTRVPANTLGPLMLVVPVNGAVQGLSGSLALTGAARDWPSEIVAVLGSLFATAQILSVTIVLVVLLLAPDGQPWNRLWRWVLRGFLLAVVLLIPVQFAAGPVSPRTSPNDNPLPGFPPGLTVFSASISDLAQRVNSTLGGIAALMIPVAMAALVQRWVQSDSEARRRTGWAIGGALATPVVIVVGTVLGIPQIYGGDPTWALATAVFPLGIAIAVLRHGLYDLDRVVSRTVSYAIVTGLVLATYAVIVTSVSRVLGETSPVAVAGATLAAAALARPLLVRVQGVVDRRFNRERVDGHWAVAEFGARLANQVDPDRVVVDLVDVTRRTLAPTSVSLWTSQR